MNYIFTKLINKFCLTAPITPPKAQDPCYPSPCGSNAICRVEGINARCECINDYQGNPFVGCRPECTSNSECSRSQACLRNKCMDPCPGICGSEAICSVINHIPVCTCPEGLEGDPFRQCNYISKRRK
jgi:hypothetical protein